MKMEAAGSSETLVLAYQPVVCHYPDDHTFGFEGFERFEVMAEGVSDTE
jgi:hypothetical protein